MHRGFRSRTAQLATAVRREWATPTDRPALADASRHRAGVVSAATIALGAPLLRAALRSPSGGQQFQRRTVALALTWSAGAFAAGLRPGWLQATWTPGRAMLRPVLMGAAATAAFSVGAVVTAQIEPLRHRISAVVDHARGGPLPLVVGLAMLTGATEELFFRGVVFDALPVTGLPPAVSSAAVYTVVTGVTGNPMLVLAAGILGLLTGVERQATGDVQGPILIHLTWSAGMLLVLPRVVAYFERRRTLLEG